LSSRLRIFIVRPNKEGLNVIQEGVKTDKLCDLGVEEFQEIVVTENDEGHVSAYNTNDPAKMCAFYHNVARHYGIERTEYEAMLPEIPESTHSNQATAPTTYESPRNNYPVEVPDQDNVIVGYPPGGEQVGYSAPTEDQY